ncbi:MAG: site-specific integrase [Burkholderiales bacterium]|nr:site-specific integrase [Burkholderiales bacterium]
MQSPNHPVSPLRLRMLEDMRMRQLAPKTQAAYIRAVYKLAAFTKQSPDVASAEDLRRFQLHLVDAGTSPITLNATITGLTFFFDVTLGRPDVMAKMQSVRVPLKLPTVLSREEVARLLGAVGHIKHQTALSVAYGTGLRVSEVVALRVTDIDSERMTLRVEQGKGLKDRYAMLSPVLLERLRVWWRVARAQGKMLDGGWLFPGRDPIEALTARQLNRAIHDAATVAKIDKRVSMHTLRHSFATHLLEQKVDIRVIQVMLGHKKLETTSKYVQVATDILREVLSPLETLQPA